MYRVAVIVSIVLLQACATPATNRVEVDKTALDAEAKSQEDLFVSRYVEDRRRLQNMTYRMTVAAADLCGERVGNAIGLQFGSLHTWPSEYQRAAKQSLGLGETISVTHVVPGSPADRADVQAGDVIVEIAGRQIGSGKKAPPVANKALEDALKGAAVDFRLNRNGQIIERSVTPVKACDSRLALSIGDEVNAYADGTFVIITRGMLRFANSDEKLAAVIAHELAHNAMGHREKVMRNFWLGSIFDLAAAVYGVNTQNTFGRMGAQAFSQGFESEADYVGLYIMHASGYSPDQAAAFWKDMGAEFPGSIRTNYTYSHPGTAERYLALEKTALEIQQKTLLGHAVRPTLKGEEFVVDDSAVRLAGDTAAGEDTASFEEVMALYDSGDYLEAKEGFEALAEQGNGTAAYNLAVMYGDGIGGPANLYEASRWMHYAAMLDVEDARRELPALAQSLAASDDEFAPAGLYFLAEAYWNGHGLDRNKTEAVDRYKKSAELDYVPAQIRVAELYYRGDGVLQRFDEAIHWYGRAAMGGNQAALRQAGVLIAQGHGSEEQKPVGYAILNALAARQDIEAAALRDQLGSAMPAEQLRVGQELSQKIYDGKLDVLSSLTQR